MDPKVRFEAAEHLTKKIRKDLLETLRSELQLWESLR
jgi:hypothetical protein